MEGPSNTSGVGFATVQAVNLNQVEDQAVEAMLPMEEDETDTARLEEIVSRAVQTSLHQQRRRHVFNEEAIEQVVDRALHSRSMTEQPELVEAIGQAVAQAMHNQTGRDKACQENDEVATVTTGARGSPIELTHTPVAAGSKEGHKNSKGPG
jgi:hypothetical protein